MESAENHYIENQEDKVKQEIEENANKEIIDIIPEETDQKENVSQPVSEETKEKIITDRPAF